MGELAVGDVVEVSGGPIAHGGHVIAHHSGRTLFVRHLLPGELAKVRITDVRSKIVRADAIEILSTSPDRVPAPCAWAGTCGGCDFQHVHLVAQRSLKAEVVRSALARAGVWDGEVEVQALDDTGLGWRTRVDWHVDASGRPGLLRHRSHEVVPVETCLIASPGISAARIPAQRVPGVKVVHATEGSDGRVSVRFDDVPQTAERTREDVHGRRWRLSPGAFWQVHPAAAGALVDAVLSLGRPAAGERWWDLYAGAGLFAAALGGAVGSEGSVTAVEESPIAVRDARRALHDLPQVHLVQSRVDDWPGSGPVDGVVLDPPRRGAGPQVMARIATAAPPRVVSVSCDPMTHARDLASLVAAGYRVEAVRAFDTFPMTHHVETVVALAREGAPDQIS